MERFFPNAQIYGADINIHVLFEEDRIKTYFIDQLDPETIKVFWNKVNVSQFDFILDDGLHTFEAGKTLFLNSIDKLSVDGVYVIEDVSTIDLLRYKNFFKKKDYIVEYVCLYRPLLPLGDNNLVVIRK